MKFKLILISLLISGCVQNYNNIKTKKPYNSTGFAYIYNQSDYQNKIINKKLNPISLEIAHNKLRAGSMIKIINLKTKENIILENTKKIQYPDFYKILITKPVADQLNLTKEFPLVEVVEVKKNKSFVAKKTKIYKEEEKIHNNAPVETVKIDNISKVKNIKKNVEYKFYIHIAEFYSKKSALFLKKRISKELITFNSKKLFIKSTKSNKISLLSGPYSSINLLKNDYTKLINFGFEELDIKFNE
tara:strand:- start:75 stop:809 length:735 start_codon:yes stop_codon:yes gene_type:complete